MSNPPTCCETRPIKPRQALEITKKIGEKQKKVESINRAWRRKPKRRRGCQKQKDTCGNQPTQQNSKICMIEGSLRTNLFLRPTRQTTMRIGLQVQPTEAAGSKAGAESTTKTTKAALGCMTTKPSRQLIRRLT
jgi:hypothetical protein